jgi:hypothetical protein
LVRYWRRKWEYNDTVHQLFVDFKKVYDSVRREVLYNILIDFAVPVQLVRLIKMCLKETYNKVSISKYLSDNDDYHLLGDDVISQKMIIIIVTAVETSNLTLVR